MKPQNPVSRALARFWSLLSARNKEFYRDKGTLIWTFVFPLIVILGFGFAFSGNSQEQFKFGVYDPHPTDLSKASPALKLEYVHYVPVENLEEGVEKVRRHQFDLLVAPREFEAGGTLAAALPDEASKSRYWVNATSPKGYFAEKLLPADYAKQEVTGKETRYIDWLIPGILAMNMMFSALFGVGYTIVRYRKNGVLKRLKATPVTAFEFLSAQVLSRIAIIQAVGVIVYAGCDALVHFQMRGSYLNLFLFMGLGGMSLISLSTVIAARISSEELAEGILNVMTWPMMLFSGVWFSLEGTNPLLRKLAQALPLTHIVDGARAIMIDGAGWGVLAPHAMMLGATTFVCLLLGSLLFRWN
jgi:ABC-2 type transport system permease protein